SLSSTLNPLQICILYSFPVLLLYYIVYSNFTLVFIFNDPPPTKIYSLPLHDALPIYIGNVFTRHYRSQASCATMPGFYTCSQRLILCPSPPTVKNNFVRLVIN